MNTNHRHTGFVAILAIVAAILAACTTTVAGHPTAADDQVSSSDSPTRPATTPISARDLLLRDGDRTPLGLAVTTPIGNAFFTSARPAQCSAALLFEDSPLRPAGSSEHAESAYSFGTSAIYAESADVYAKTLERP